MWHNCSLLLLSFEVWTSTSVIYDCMQNVCSTSRLTSPSPLNQRQTHFILYFRCVDSMDGRSIGTCMGVQVYTQYFWQKNNKLQSLCTYNICICLYLRQIVLIWTQTRNKQLSPSQSFAPSFSWWASLLSYSFYAWSHWLCRSRRCQHCQFPRMGERADARQRRSATRAARGGATPAGHAYFASSFAYRSLL